MNITNLVALASIGLAACGGSAIVDNAIPCSNEASVWTKGPADGVVALGAKDVVFLNVYATVMCGTTTMTTLSLYIQSETPTSYCAAPCGPFQDQWNFQQPRLAVGSTVLEPTSFQLTTDYNGSSVIEALFKQPLSLTADEDSEFKFLLNVAESEVVPGSLLNRRFRASLGEVGFERPTAIVINGVSATHGGYQTIVSP